MLGPPKPRRLNQPIAVSDSDFERAIWVGRQNEPVGNWVVVEETLASMAAD